MTINDGDELEIAKLEVDELWSYIGNKKNDQWLWLVLHKNSRQVLAMQVGPRDKKTAELLFAKLPESLKKKPSISQISLMSTMRPFLGVNTNQLANNLVRRATLKDLIVRSDRDVHGL